MDEGSNSNFMAVTTNPHTVAHIEASASPLFGMGRLRWSGQGAPAVLGAMAKVMKGVEAVNKSRENTQQGYMFRGIDEVYKAIHQLLADNDLVTIPVVLGRTERETKSANGKPQLSVVLRVEYWLTSCADGSVMILGPIYAEALDNSDKATNKAMSFAQKYTLLQTFTIPTGDVAEGDKETIERGSSEPPRGRQQQQRQKQREPGEDAPSDVITTETAKKVYAGFAELGVTKLMLDKKIGYGVDGLETGWLETLRQWRDQCRNKANIEKIFGSTGSTERAEEMNKEGAS